MNQRKTDKINFKSGISPIPSHLRPQRIDKTALHKNKFIESITRTSLWVPQTMFGTTVIFFLWYAITQSPLSLTVIVSVYVFGIFSWSFVEYMIHRFFYHSETELEGFYKLQHLAHGVHHHHPKDKDRLAMPPLPGILLSSLLFAVFWLIFQGYVVAFFPGFLTGYIGYIGMHYAQHRYKLPNYKPWRRLWQYHMIHHYKNPYICYGVSTNLWDFVFGTLPNEDEKKGVSL